MVCVRPGVAAAPQADPCNTEEMLQHHRRVPRPGRECGEAAAKKLQRYILIKLLLINKFLFQCSSNYC